jgi:tetratricopeptide (TPR) repeat protein
MTNTSGGRGRDGAASRSSEGRDSRSASNASRGASKGGSKGVAPERGSQRRAQGASGRVPAAGATGRGATGRSGGAPKSGSQGRSRTGRDPGLLPLLGPEDDRPYARARDARGASPAPRSGRRPLGDRAQSGVRKRATGADGGDQSRKLPVVRDDKRRGGDPKRAARREGEVTGPFTRRREIAEPAEEKRPVLRLSKAGESRAETGDRTKKRPGARTSTARAKKGPTGDGAAIRKRRRPTEATEELRRLAGGNANRAVDTLARASEAFTRGRERDALRILRPLTEAYPTAVAVRELAGLCRYRIGSYAAAADDLAAFAQLSGSTEQHPVLMDCRRAQGKLRDVEELWEELRETSPSAELVTEGRIVVAGAFADAGRLAEAIDLLARRAEVPGRTKEHTVRLWYALADLEERAGDVPRARALFEQVQRFDAEFADVAERLAALS